MFIDDLKVKKKNLRYVFLFKEVFYIIDIVYCIRKSFL